MPRGLSWSGFAPSPRSKKGADFSVPNPPFFGSKPTIFRFQTHHFSVPNPPFLGSRPTSGRGGVGRAAGKGAVGLMRCRTFGLDRSDRILRGSSFTIPRALSERTPSRRMHSFSFWPDGTAVLLPTTGSMLNAAFQASCLRTHWMVAFQSTRGAGLCPGSWTTVRPLQCRST